jgi:GntR family transcriptional regulator
MTITKRVQRRSGVNRYHQLYTLICQALTEGSIKAGGALPTESALMREHAVSRNTVRRALEKLEREKRIVRRRGSGTYAREQPGASVTRSDVLNVLKDFRRLELETTWRLLHFGFVATPAYILDQVPTFGQRSLLVQRTRAIRGRTFTLATSYLVDGVGKRLRRSQLGKRALFLAVEELGIKLAMCEQSTAAIAANAIVAEQFGVLIGAPLLYLERISYAEDNSVIEFTEMTYPANLYRQRLTMPIDRSDNTLPWL